MKQVQVSSYGPAEVLKTVPYKRVEPGPGQVEVAIYAAGVNPADTYLRAGNYEFLSPELPFVPGYDGAGIITKVGDGENMPAVGDRVWISTIPTRSVGTYADFLVCDASITHPLPEQYSFSEGAAIGVPYLTAYRALFQRGNAQAGETVLIHGASGSVGLAAVQLATATGLKVIGTGSTGKGRELVESFGAVHTLNHSEPGILDHLKGITEGRGVDLVIEMAAHRNLDTDCQALALGGRVVVVGSRGALNLTPRTLMVSEADIRGTAIWNMSPEDLAEATRRIEGRLNAGQLRPHVSAELPLGQAREAHARIEAGKANGKLVLTTTH
jgi:NADPH2:quinone reductase